MGAPDQALASLSEAVRLNPGDAAAYEGRAVAFEAVGNPFMANADRRTAQSLRGPPPATPGT